ncbi:acyl-phosphate glycerol 3-phosphate acyltransferase [Erythrobacter sp. SG61-1L]|uniref:lysophospholipid acyltransferase family protein n=1 Tax=Erythrobacter sp. SG61-1L TaxID=1603897 RepID=UPI0006C93736|nr:lysophospholipid acyltransferase family protein [Erythrobacter sp. SG61-1L]KPL68102.1 acyl-phosphate glycerol 3-phosphate acyltransferase [Erythrobacter sp. SG61-1L]
MSGALALDPPRITPLGWLLIAVKLVLMVALLALCLPLHGLWKLLRLDRFWPRVFLTGIGAICGLQIERRGRPVPGALLISNHVSWLDIPGLAQTAGSAFVAHDGLSAFPLLRFLCRLNETVFVARHDRTSVARQVEDVRHAIDHGGTLTLFAEGTTSDGTGLLAFKSALFSAVSPLPDGVAIQPVLLAYSEVPGIAWVGEEHGLDNFKRILARLRPLHLTVHFLPPLTGEQLASRKTMAIAAQEAVRNALGR